MTQTLYLKKGNTSPSLVYVLDSSEIDLEGASAFFTMAFPSGEIKVDRQPASIVVDGGITSLQYDWRAEDTDTVSIFFSEFEIIYPGGAEETIPNKVSDNIMVIVGQKVGQG